MTESTAVQDPPVPTEAEVAADLRVDDALALLREYLPKLRLITERARRVGTELQAGKRLAAVLSGSKPDPADRAADAGEVRTLFMKLRPPATDLARYASGLIEHAKLNRLTNLELRLRLAEFESALEAATQAAGKLPR